MVRASLVDSDIQDGYKLVSALMASDLRFNTPHYLVKAAFWLFDRDSSDWSLVIATPLVDQRGPFSAYTDINGALRNLQPISLTMQDITILSPTNKLVTAIKKVSKVPPRSIGSRIGRSRIDDTYVEDAYVYSLINKAA
jgi:hypothetical protein